MTTTTQERQREWPSAAWSAHLEQARWPVLVICPSKGQLMALNAPAARVLALDSRPNGRSITLDRAMPAVTRLARLVERSTPGACVQERLTFWLNGQSVEAACSCTPVLTEDGERAVIVELDPPAPTEPDVKAVEPTPPSAPAAPVKNDHETLAEIARRIRAGRNAPGVAQPAQRVPSPTARSNTMAGPSPEERLEAIARLADGLRRDERIKGSVEEICAQARAALAELQRVAEPPHRPVFVELDLNRLITEAVEAHKPALTMAGVAVELALAPNLPRVIADTRGWQHILAALLSNVLHHAGPSATVRLSTRYPLAGPVVVEIADDGPGMSEEAIATALDGGRKARQARGGLAVAATLAAGNGARLGLAAAPRGGLIARVEVAKDRVVPV